MPVRCLRSWSRTSLRSDDAPKRNRSGVIQSGPRVSWSRQMYCTDCFAVRIPPAGFIPIASPVSSCTSRITSSMQSVTGSVAAGVLDGDDLLVDAADLSREKGPAVDHHVDLVRAGFDRRPNVRELDVERR